MTTIARVISNYEKGDGDYIVIVVDGETIWKGRSLPNNPFTFVDIAKEIGQADSVKFIHLTNEQMENWEEHYND